MSLKTLAPPLVALLAFAGLAGCSDSGTSQEEPTGPGEGGEEPVLAPEPVSLHVAGDAMGSFGSSWSWPVQGVPSLFLVTFRLGSPSGGSTFYALQEAHVRLLDPSGAVRGEYQTPLKVAEWEEMALEFQAPPYAAVAQGEWVVEFSAAQAFAHYDLQVTVEYPPPLYLEEEAQEGDGAPQESEEGEPAGR